MDARKKTRRILALAVLLSLPAATAHPIANTSPASDLDPLAQANRRLAEQLALARGTKPYLVLEPAVPRLRLMCSGAILREYAVLGVEVGTPSVAFVKRSAPPTYSDRSRKLVELDPQRHRVKIEVVAPAADEPPGEPIVPPDPAEAQPAPQRFFLRFDDGLALEVRQASEAAQGPPRLSVRLRWRFQDMLEAAGFHPVGRVRIVMPPSEAGSLYRGVPATAPLMVL